MRERKEEAADHAAAGLILDLCERGDSRRGRVAQTAMRRLAR